MTETTILEYQLKTYDTLPSDKTDKKSKFALYLKGEFIGLVASPVYDGARLLLSLGYSPDTLMTTKAKDSQNVSWKPQALTKWAKLTTEEQANREVRSRSFREWGRVGIPVGSSSFPIPSYQNNTKGAEIPSCGLLEVVL